ncbi:MAG: 50S ribosomal protein L25 [Candidatus Azambacteria bacterium GW2011_GWA2_39_10]|uniref:Large ribosomal subunit protein bL25 n=1 Tax=Candidatus Azambacteria bacterium GW2011_GWA2_39_10 TaxID=1618611 RepID=A0A0G0LSG7_9BACT|nr:MAG: 50S ribosomal protein L25 [Candidatus Azambacteria bacterium GW2011_GWA2_39_10]
MTTLEIKSKKREIFGKKVNTLRNQGLIPAVVYGGSGDSIPLVLELKEFKRVFKHAGETTLVKLFIDDAKFSAKGGPASGWKNVLIHDNYRDPITDEIKHVDFYEVKMDEKIIAKIPLVFIGNAPATSDLGGILVKAMQELEIRALPADLPHEVEIDISSLKTFDDNILIKDIKMPKNVEILDNISASVASVVPPRSEAEIEALSGQIEEKIENVKVETEEKTAERIQEKKIEATE